MGRTHGSRGMLCCGACLGFTALVFSITSVATVFWFSTGFKNCDNTHDYNIVYGPSKVCAYYGSCGSSNQKSLDTEDADWECVHWNQAEVNGTSFWPGAPKCSKAMDAGLGLGIVGVVLTVPGAFFCLVLLCCADRLRSTHLARLFTGVLMGAFGFASIFWVSAAVVTTIECEDFKENVQSGLVALFFKHTAACEQTHSVKIDTSLGLMIGALLATACAACGVLVAVFSFSHCEDIDHCGEASFEQAALRTTPSKLYNSVEALPTAAPPAGGWSRHNGAGWDTVEGHETISSRHGDYIQA